MTGLRTAFAIAALIAFGASCDSSTSNPIELTIFHTNDIHSHLRAAKTDPFGLGGLARMATLLKTLRGKAPLSLTLDAGDWSEGTWYYSVDEGSNMLRFLDEMGFDAVCLGNHDFLNGPDQVIRTIQGAKPSFPVLAANIDASAYANAPTLGPLLPASIVKTVGGLKVGLIGLTTYGFMFSGFFSPVQITNPIDAATKIAQQMRPNVDVLVIISHNDFTTNLAIAQQVPGVDVVISGHTHKKTPTPVMVVNDGRQVPVVETGAWGKFLGELKLEVDQTQKTVRVGGYTLHPLTSDIVEDPTLAQQVNQQDLALDAKFNDDVTREVAVSDLELDQEEGVETPLGNLAVKAYESATGADFSMEEVSLTGVSVAQGPVTLMDLHDVVPHVYNPQSGKEWTLKVWNAPGTELSELFDVFYTVTGLVPLSSPLGWLSSEDLQVTWDPTLGHGSVPMPAIQTLTVSQGSNQGTVNPSQRYKVALSDGLLGAINQANSLLGLGLNLTDIQDTGVEAWRAVVNYAAAQKELTKDSLRVGGHAWVNGPDLSVQYYGIGWDLANLSVEVENLGLDASSAANLTCSTGLPNDLVDFDSDGQVWAQIGTAAVPVLAPGTRVTLTLPWSSQNLAKGYWPVQCTVAGGGDLYSANNSGERVFKVQ